MLQLRVAEELWCARRTLMELRFHRWKKFGIMPVSSIRDDLIHSLHCEENSILNISFYGPSIVLQNPRQEWNWDANWRKRNQSRQEDREVVIGGCREYSLAVSTPGLPMPTEQQRNTCNSSSIPPHDLHGKEVTPRISKFLLSGW